MAHLKLDTKGAIRRATIIRLRHAVLASPARGGPFIFAEFVAHDSILQFRSLDHVHAGAMTYITSVFRHSGRGRTCR